MVASRTVGGGRVATLADNRAEAAALLYAVPAAGRVLVPLNTRHAPAELAAQLARSDARLLIASAVQLDRIRPEVPAGVAMLDLDATGSLTAPPTSAAPNSSPGAAPAPASSPLPATVAPPDPLATASDATAMADDVAWIIFTSGTTGRPKGALLTHTSLLAAVRSTAAGRPLTADEVYLYPFPLFHVAAYNVLHAHSRGRPVVLLAKFVADDVLRLSERHGVTAMSLAPTMLRMLLDAIGSRPDARLASVRTVAYGAAPMAPALLAEATAALGCDFAQGYGMTELSGNAVFLSPDDHRAALAGDTRLAQAAGRAAPGVEVRIAPLAGPDGVTAVAGTDSPVGPGQPGQPGEILVRAAQVCAGYLDDPTATATTIVDGWLHTGDVGTLDDDGLLTIVDRAKDVIVSGGENVASREVEDVLLAHPAVAQAAVIGLPDSRWGEAVTAVVVLAADPATADRGTDPGTAGSGTAVVVLAADPGTADPADLTSRLRAHVGERLAGYKKPRRVLVVEALPVNAGGKVDKRALRERFTD